MKYSAEQLQTSANLAQFTCYLRGTLQLLCNLSQTRQRSRSVPDTACSVCYKRVAKAMSVSVPLQLSMLSFFWRNGVETPEPLKADVTGKVSVQWTFLCKHRAVSSDVSLAAKAIQNGWFPFQCVFLETHIYDRTRTFNCFFLR